MGHPQGRWHHLFEGRKMSERFVEAPHVVCTDEEIGSISGHLSKAMIAKYAGMARQIMLARSATAKRGD